MPVLGRKTYATEEEEEQVQGKVSKLCPGRVSHTKTMKSLEGDNFLLIGTRLNWPQPDPNVGSIEQN